MKDTKIYISLAKKNKQEFESQVRTLATWCESNYYKVKNNGEYFYCEPMSEAEKVKKQNGKIVTLIRAKYSLNDELAILRQRYTKPTEFAEYNTFVEQCKAQAKL